MTRWIGAPAVSLMMLASLGGTCGALADTPLMQAVTRDQHTVDGYWRWSESDGPIFVGTSQTWRIDQLLQATLPVQPRMPPAGLGHKLYLTHGDHFRAHIERVILPHQELQTATETPPSTLHEHQATRWVAAFNSTTPIPVDAIWRITALPLESPLHFSDFEGPVTEWSPSPKRDLELISVPAEAGNYALRPVRRSPESAPATPLTIERWPASGYLTCRFFVPAQTPQTAASGEARLRLQPADRSPVTVVLGADHAAYSVIAPSDLTGVHQSVPRHAGWHRLFIIWSHNQLEIVIDDFSLFRGEWHLPDAHDSKKAAAALWFDSTVSEQGRDLEQGREAEQGPEPDATAQPTVSLIDDLLIAEQVLPTTIPWMQPAAQQLDLLNRDQLFGTLLDYDHRRVGLQMSPQADKRRFFAWPQIQAITCARRQHLGALTVPQSGAPTGQVDGQVTDQIKGQAITGSQVQIQMQPWFPNKNTGQSDSLRGALVGVTDQGCELVHPLLGRIPIPWRHIQRIRHEFQGAAIPIDGQPRHLGNEMKPGFLVPAPDGTRASWSVTIPDEPRQRASIHLATRDLEPSGPSTRSHRWLRALRSGHLTSELWWDDKRVAVLNELLTGPGQPGQPQSIRAEVPLAMVSAGAHQLEIRLQPLTEQGTEYDDWELLELRLELHAPD